MYDGGHPNLVLRDNQEGEGGEGDGRGFRRERTKVALWPIHSTVKTIRMLWLSYNWNKKKKILF